ncbi:hypothetical protein F7725_013407 [Dissostichus mawsoni]|uniref:Uncharacterized protein n=1 Tax=Dissostichus mawsoni TaxID=36200 RepID=A0A7J5YQA6_DISMA|nr:hypothetical protein F7725_013407 [Dissostichus mawsoni]
MEQLQLLRVFLLCLSALNQCVALPLGSQCVEDSFCTYSLQDYHSQLVNLPSQINERSIATWSYVENIDLNRVPQVIHEASCHSSHSCRGLDSAFGLETIPVSLRMPVLRKNPSCFPSASYSLEVSIDKGGSYRPSFKRGSVDTAQDGKACRDALKARGKMEALCWGHTRLAVDTPNHHLAMETVEVGIKFWIRN